MPERMAAQAAQIKDMGRVLFSNQIPGGTNPLSAVYRVFSTVPMTVRTSIPILQMKTFRLRPHHPFVNSFFTSLLDFSLLFFFLIFHFQKCFQNINIKKL
jgi:hypothetical protein